MFYLKNKIYVGYVNLTHPKRFEEATLINTDKGFKITLTLYGVTPSDTGFYSCIQSVLIPKTQTMLDISKITKHPRPGENRIYMFVNGIFGKYAK